MTASKGPVASGALHVWRWQTRYGADRLDHYEFLFPNILDAKGRPARPEI